MEINAVGILLFLMCCVNDAAATYTPTGGSGAPAPAPAATEETPTEEATQPEAGG